MTTEEGQGGGLYTLRDGAYIPRRGVRTFLGAMDPSTKDTPYDGDVWFDGTNEKRWASGAWVSTSGSGGGTPATTVTDETTYSVTKAVGTLTSFAREDHTHGSPSLSGTAPVSVDKSAASAGSATLPSKQDHKHDVSVAAPAIVLGTAGADGVASTLVRSDATIAAFDATVPVTQNYNDVAATGAASVAARRDHKHGMPTAGSVSFSTNSYALGTAAAAGTSPNPARSDDTILAFDTTVPVTQAAGDAAATGVATVASRRDHKHGMPSTYPATMAAPALTLGTANSAGAATTAFATNSTIAAFDATVPTTSALADAAATGSATVAARRDHLHGREAFGTNPANSALGTTSGAGGSATTPAKSDHSHGVTAYAFSVGLTVLSPAVADHFCWVAPFACTVTNVKGYQDVGTGSTVNAFTNTLASPTLLLASNMTVNAADTVVDGGAVQNTALASGAKVYVRIATVAGSPNKIAVRIFLTRP